MSPDDHKYSLVATSADSVPSQRSGLTRGLPIAQILLHKMNNFD